MEIQIIRKYFTPISTVSEVYFDGKKMGYCLEDFDRALSQDMPLPEIVSRKIHSLTAIPTGRYELVVTWSDRFGRLLPLLLKVPGFEGIRWHTGNYNSETDGCLLVGLAHSTDMVTQSRDAFAQWFPIIQRACKTGKVFITIQREKTAWMVFQDQQQRTKVVA